MLLEKTQSVCPECFKSGDVNKIDASLVEENGKVYIEKTCEKHGSFKDVIADYDIYTKVMKYSATGSGVSNPKIKTANCPFDCGLCAGHKSQSVLTNIIVTNRCNLRCSYCFANAGAVGYVYEPSLDEIRKMLIQIRSEEPVPGKAIQLTGGEPTIRDDLIDIIKMTKEVGFTHIQLNTNGIRIAENPQLAVECKKAGVNTVYMSFDGVTRQSNPWIEQNIKTIEACRNAGMHVVLVPCVINGKNDSELGDIIRFAIKNIDIVRGMNFQPVSFVGRIDKLPEETRKEGRITYSEMIKKIEKQMPEIKADDWYPVPFVLPVSHLAENIKNKPQVEFTCSPLCGGATYVFVDGENITPVTRFIDVEKLFAFIEEQSQTKGGLKKAKIALSMLTEMPKFMDKEKTPKKLNIVNMLANAIVGGSYNALREFHHNSLYLGSMWFQDVWNMNLGRLERCVIHYTTPDGIVPFCAYNGLGYGQRIEKKYGISFDEWEKKSGRTLRDDLWKGGPIS